MRSIVFAAGLAVLLGLAGCEGEPEQTPPTQAEQTARAAGAFDPTAFDTVTWESQEAAIERGRDIYKWTCAECHGAEGRGDSDFVVDGDTIKPPSFRAEDWGFADNPSALHQKVFVGSNLGMPHWGLRRMDARDVVAVERYIRLELIQGAADREAPAQG